MSSLYHIAHIEGEPFFSCSVNYFYKWYTDTWFNAILEWMYFSNGQTILCFMSVFCTRGVGWIRCETVAGCWNKWNVQLFLVIDVRYSCRQSVIFNIYFYVCICIGYMWCLTSAQIQMDADEESVWMVVLLQAAFAHHGEMHNYREIGPFSCSTDVCLAVSFTHIQDSIFIVFPRLYQSTFIKWKPVRVKT